jgi:hypothetical protein
MHFHSGWSWLAEGFGHGGYYAGDDRYRSVDHQQDRNAPRQENQIVRNVKPDHPVSPEATTASGQQHKQWVPEAVSSANGSGAIKIRQGRGVGLRSMMKRSTSCRKGLEEIAEKQNKAQGKETKIKADAVSSFQQQPNRKVWFGKPDHSISPGSVQKGGFKDYHA